MGKGKMDRCGHDGMLRRLLLVIYIYTLSSGDWFA